jgi:hypothetical protein
MVVDVKLWSFVKRLCFWAQDIVRKWKWLKWGVLKALKLWRSEKKEKKKKEEEEEREKEKRAITRSLEEWCFGKD